MALEMMLTTTDNPYDPWDEWYKWYKYDTMSGYNLTSMVERLYTERKPASSIDFNDDDLRDAIMLEVLEVNVYGNIIPMFREVDEYEDVPDIEVEE